MNRSVLITGFIILQVLLGLNVPKVSGEKRWVDLTHSFDETTIYWPTSKGFQLDSVHHGLTEGGVLVRVEQNQRLGTRGNPHRRPGPFRQGEMACRRNTS